MWITETEYVGQDDYMGRSNLMFTVDICRILADYEFINILEKALTKANHEEKTIRKEISRCSLLGHRLVRKRDLRKRLFDLKNHMVDLESKLASVYRRYNHPETAKLITENQHEDHVDKIRELFYKAIS